MVVDVIRLVEVVDSLVYFVIMKVAGFVIAWT